jgi:predicted nucleic acid-binding protein
LALAVVDASVIVDLLVEHPRTASARTASAAIDGVAPALLEAEVL